MLLILATEERAKFLQHLQIHAKSSEDKLKRLAAYLIKILGSSKEFPDLDQVLAQFSAELGSPMGKAMFNQLLHSLKVHLEQFMVAQMLRESPLWERKLLILSLENRQASEFLLEAIEKQYKTLSEMAQNVAYFDELHFLEARLLNHPNSGSETKKKASLPSLIQSLDGLWINCRLAHTWNFWLSSTHQPHNADLGRAFYEAPILAFHQNQAHRDNDFACAYAIALGTALDDDFDIMHFNRIHAHALKAMIHAEPSETTGIMNMLINYMTFTVSRQGKQHLPVLLALYRRGLESKSILRNGYLSYVDFNNTILTGCRVGDFVFVAQVIDLYAELLSPEQQGAAKRIARARLAFYQGDFHKVMRILREGSKFISDVDKYYEKMLRVQCYYEMGEFDLLESHLEALRKFGERRPMLHGSRFQAFLTYIKLFRRLVTDPDADGLSRLLDEFQALPNLAHVEWIRAKTQAKIDAVLRTAKKS